VKLSGLLDASTLFRFFTNDCLTGDVDKLAFADLAFGYCLMQLFSSGVEHNNLMPGGLAALVIDRQGKAADVLFTAR
jgi:hypothetical protein